MRIAIIPARGGSKRIPKKNIKFFHGVPMLEICIRKLQQTNVFDRIIVSTDSREIADVADNAGAEIPFLRSHELSDDYSDTRSVILDVIKRLEKEIESVDLVACVYPCIPLISVTEIKNIYHMALNNQKGYTFPVASFPYPVQRALYLNKRRNVEMLFPEHYSSRSQDLAETFHDAGCMYFATPQVWRQSSKIFSSMSRGVPIPRYMVQDIDTPEDWMHAELLYKMIKDQQI